MNFIVPHTAPFWFSLNPTKKYFLIVCLYFFSFHLFNIMPETTKGNSLLSKRYDRVSTIVDEFLGDLDYAFATANGSEARVKDIYFHPNDGGYDVYLEDINCDTKWIKAYAKDVTRALGKRYVFRVKKGNAVIQFTPPKHWTIALYFTFFMCWLGLMVCVVGFDVIPLSSRLADYVDTHETPFENMRKALIFSVMSWFGFS